MILLDVLGELLYPPKCVLCRRLLQKGEVDLCRGCRINAPLYPYGAKNLPPKGKVNLHFLDSITAIWYYEGSVRRSLLRFKFYRAPHLASGYGRMLAAKLRQELPQGVDYITWVPVSARRRFQRGYDQAELLSRALSRELGIPIARMLKKVRNNPPQSGIASPEARRANVLGAYVPAGKISITGKRILLVDDIFTTGATCEECARVLSAMGAKEIHCAAVASAHKHNKK